jgi:hypothetical protein
MSVGFHILYSSITSVCPKLNSGQYETQRFERKNVVINGPTSLRLYFATHPLEREWGIYVFMAEKKADIWRTFFWSQNQWIQMDPFHFNVLRNISTPQIDDAEESYVEELAEGATTQETLWVPERNPDNIPDWTYLAKGFIDELSRDEAIRSIVENPLEVDLSDVEEDEKSYVVRQMFTDEELLAMHDTKGLRAKYLHHL